MLWDAFSEFGIVTKTVVNAIIESLLCVVVLHEIMIPKKAAESPNS